MLTGNLKENARVLYTILISCHLSVNMKLKTECKELLCIRFSSLEGAK